MTGTMEESGSMSTTTLRQRLGQEAELVVLDVRTPGEFRAGHIPEALNVPVDQLAPYADRIAAAEQPLVLVCQSGSRSQTARQRLVEAGAEESQVLAGGMGAWTEAGGVTTEAEPGRWGMERQVRLVAGAIVLAGIVGSFFWSKARLLSAAIGGGLVFSAVTDTCGMGALLAKLPYNRGGKADIDSVVARLERRT
jgi:rhodanese-related sulfurtransferase